jgi:hypothetical protein
VAVEIRRYLGQPINWSYKQGFGKLPRPRQAQRSLGHEDIVTYSCTGNNHLDLATGSRHELAELVTHALKQTQSVVLGEGSKEVLDGLVASARLLL